jgi:hypothetical protein
MKALKNLAVIVPCWSESWSVFPIQNSSLRKLEVLQGRRGARNQLLGATFWKTFVLPNCHTLTKVYLTDTEMTVDSFVNLAQLQSLSLNSCRFVGWAHLCKSLTSLKSLELYDVDLVDVSTEDILSFLPPSVISSLDSINIRCVSKSNKLPSPWLNNVAASLASLRVLCVDAISVDTLEKILKHSLKLEEYHHRPFEYRRRTGPTNDHLHLLSQFASSPLKLLQLRLGQFSSKDLTDFAVSFPLSVKSLDLSGCRAVTTTNLRALFQLPLRELYLQGMYVQPEHKSELESLLQTMEKTRAQLRKFVIFKTGCDTER